MTDDLSAAAGSSVSRETENMLSRYVDLLRAENERQNLVAQSTLEAVWQRHILDGAQLLRFARPGRWADLGSGAGLPGLVTAILSGEATTLIEPRRLRADFLRHCVEELHLTNVTVVQAKAERASGKFDVITARAIAPLSNIFAMSVHLAHDGTKWILPKGQSGAKELAEAQRAWQGRFRSEPSITEDGAVIVLAEGVKPRGGTSR